MESMILASFFDIIRSFIDNIPKMMYLLYASLTSLLDFLQLFMRKLAGLDTYYVDGSKETGDVVTNFIEGIVGMGDQSYSTLSTVFWSFIILGIILLFCTTLIAIIRMHFNYDENMKKGITSPLKIVGQACKCLMLMIAIPMITVLGLWMSEAILVALDTITSASESTVESLYPQANELLESGESGNGTRTYFRYDFFGLDSYSTNITFSGYMFQSAAYTSNRVRAGDWGVGTDMCNANGLFDGQNNETLAIQVDYAFMGNLHLKEDVSMPYVTTPWIGVDTGNFFRWSTFNEYSKYNVYSVWYYYNLWQFNWIVGFAGIVVCFGLFINIIMGLIQRIFMVIGLFLLSPLFIGIVPLDSGEALKKWRQKFIGYIIMAYGSILGMNIFFLIFPEIQRIRWFNLGTNFSVAGNSYNKNILDILVDAIVIIVGLLTIKKFIAVISELVGAENAEKAGGEMQEEFGKTLGKAGKLATGAAMVPLKAGAAAGKAAFKVGKGAVKTVGHGLAGAGRGIKGAISTAAANSAMKRADKQNKALSTITKDSLKNADRNKGLAMGRLTQAQERLKNATDSKQRAKIKEQIAREKSIIKANDKHIKLANKFGITPSTEKGNSRWSKFDPTKQQEAIDKNNKKILDAQEKKAKAKETLKKSGQSWKMAGVSAAGTVGSAVGGAFKVAGGTAINSVGFVGGGVKQIFTENMKMGNGFIDGWGHNATSPSKWFEKRPNYEKNSWKEAQKQTDLAKDNQRVITDLAKLLQAQGTAINEIKSKLNNP